MAKMKILLKKILLILLILHGSVASLAAPEKSCQDLFATSAPLPEQAEKPLSPYEQALKNARDKLATHKSIQFRKNKIFLSFFRRGFLKPKAVEFDNQRFIAKIADDIKVLQAAGESDQGIASAELIPQDFEESLALFAAITELNPETSGLHVIKNFLLRASEKDIKEVRQLLRFDANRMPAELHRAVAKMWFLAHSPQENFNFILSHELNPQVSQLVFQHAAISVLHHSLVDGMRTLGIAEASGLKATSKQVYEKYKLALKLGVNFALGAVITHYPAFVLMAGLPFLTHIPDLKSMEKAIENLTEQERSQIMLKDFSSLSPEVGLKLRQAARNQRRWKAFLNIVYYGVAIYILYTWEEEFRHYFFNTDDANTRAQYELNDLKIWQGARQAAGLELSAEAEAQQKQIFHSFSDQDLREYYRANSYYLQQAH